MSRWYKSEDTRQGARDFERGGRYGYDDERYRSESHEDREYRQGFDDARRAEEQRREEREQEDLEESARERIAHRRTQ